MHEIKLEIAGDIPNGCDNRKRHGRRCNYARKIYSVVLKLLPHMGHEFEVICDINKMSTMRRKTRKDKLITEDDDYLWVD